MHCSDEDLLAYLDGELPVWQRIRVRRHLFVCWQCRTRTAAYEQQIQKLTRAMEDWQYPGPRWLVDGRLALNRRMRESETSGDFSVPKRTVVSHRWTWSLVALAALAIIEVIVVRGPAPQPLAAPEVFRRAQDVERRLYRQPVEQTFAVQVAQVLPARKPALSRLHIWSDRNSGRFASKWYGEDGSYKQALWQPHPGNEYLYDSGISRTLVHRTSHQLRPTLFTDISSSAVDTTAMEAAFMRWMESRTWTPLSLAPEASTWLSSGGLIAQSELVQNTDGSRLIRISVVKRSGPTVVALTIDFDAGTYQPRVQALRYETGGRAVELRLTATAIRPVRSSEMPAALFSPDVANPAETALASRPEVNAETLPLPSGGTGVRIESEVEAAIRMTEAQYILHASRVCLGEPARVEETDAGIRVQNLGQISANWPEAYTSVANLQDVTGALADLRNNFRLPAEEPNSPVPRIALLHAWALRRLGQDFPRDTTGVLPPRSTDQLQSMGKDHISALHSALGSLGGISRPPQLETGQGRDWRESASIVLDILLDLNGQSSLDDASIDRVGAELRSLTESFGAETRR